MLYLVLVGYSESHQGYGENMKVCCYDCGKTDVKMFERPRSKYSGMKNTVDVCRQCQISWYKKHKIFLPRYNFKCPECGHEQSAAPSISMNMGRNHGHGSCMKCKTFLHLEIIDDMHGSEMKAILWNKYLKNNDSRISLPEFPVK